MNSDVSSNKRILYLDIIKVLALLMVIYNHCDDILFSSSRSLFIIHNILLYTSKAAVPLFFMVSGALIMERRDSTKKLIKRIFRILVPFIIVNISWSLFKSGYIDIKMMLKHNEDFFAYWLWFLISMMIIYLLLPVIRKYVLKYQESKKLNILIYSLTFVCSIIYTVLCTRNFIANLVPMSILYFIFGYLLSKKKSRKLYKNISLFVLPLFVFIPCYIALMLKNNMQQYYFLDDYKNIYTFFIATSIFILIKYFFENIRKSNELTELINHLSDDSYGIYLFHLFIIELMMKTEFMKELISFNKVESVFVLIAIVVISLDIPVYILKQIPVIKNYL